MTQYEHFERGLARPAYLVALTDRETTDATAPHEQIAAEQWAALAGPEYLRFSGPANA
jgi:hypothetical protein